MSEFVGLKSKMYSLVTMNNEEIEKAKGVNKNVVKNAKNLLRFCLIKKLLDIKWKELKVNSIELEVMMFVKFYWLVLKKKKKIHIRWQHWYIFTNI